MRYLSAVALLLAVALGAGRLGAEEAGMLDPEMAKIAQSVRQLQREISTINLLNGLNLTKPQQEKMLEIGVRFRAANAKAVEGITAEMLLDAERSFMTLRAEIQKGLPADGEVPNAAAKIEKTIKELREKGQAAAADEIEALDVELNKLLTPGQLQVVAEYKACLIPPANLKNPVRAGQASDSLQQVRALRTLRDVPEKSYPKARDKMIDKYLDYVEKHQIRLTDKERERWAQQMRDVAERARKLNDAAFELEKERLAQALQLDAFVEKVRKEMAERQPERYIPKVSKAGHFLLVPELAPLMRERLNLHPETGKMLVANSESGLEAKQGGSASPAAAGTLAAAVVVTAPVAGAAGANSADAGQTTTGADASAEE